MKYRKCDLCGVDDALKDDVLCLSCREAIARLLAIGSSERAERDEDMNQELEAADRLERKQNTRKAGE